MTPAVTRRPKRTKRRRTFTARTIAGLKPEAQAVDWFDADTPGLAIHVSPGGAKSWYLFYTKGRTVRRVKLGAWPDVELAKARRLARHQRDRIDTEGADPAHERREARDAFTVGALAKLFIEQHAKGHKRTWKDDQWRIDRYILPAWKSRPVGDIKRRDVHVVLDEIAADGKPVQANRVQALISKLWNFAIDRGHAEINPCHRMAKRAPERARTTVLSDDAMRALWAALDADPGDASDALRLRVLTGQRGGEVHRMAWADVDIVGAVWTIPAEAAKNRRAHRVPLAGSALELLKARDEVRSKDETHVFPGLYHQRKDLRALGAVHGDAYRWHDLRRTVVTRLAGLGFHEDTIGRVVNHAKRGITATVYNQHAYDSEKRTALEAWDRELQRILREEPRTVAAVLPLIGRRA
ncbi:MAG: integrase arm-type DNA-binding domain-containing protein [Chloroflexi bacterium]|nr:integrase arm-type DNA-binding domain-containing protein [Chloroflexota bacterium]